MPMNDKVFVDTNIFIYLYSNDEPIKKSIAEELFVKYDISISIQVLNELSNVLIKKIKLGPVEVDKVIEEASNACVIEPIYVDSIRESLKIMTKYKYSYYDSLIITSALESNCKVLFSEDMQDGQIIEDKLIIYNPFITQEFS
jgi:predicted nucleic acid-binding protein